MRLLAFGFLIHFIRHGMVFPLIPLYAQALGAMESRVGMVVACFHLLSLFLAIPMGGLMGRFGLRPMLALGVLCNIGYSLLLLVSASIWSLVAAQVIGGMGFLLLIIATQTYVGGRGENRDRERGFGLITLAAAVGQTLGPALGGLLLSWADYVSVFQVALILALLGSVVVAVREPATSPAGIRAGHNQDAGQIGKLLGNKHLLAVLAFTFSVMVVVSLRGSFLPLLLQAKGMSEGTIGVLLSCFALAMTLIRTVVGRILGALTRLQVLMITLACVLFGAGAVPFFSTPVALAVALALFGLGFGMSQPLSMVMISDVSGSGLAMGLRFFTITLATFLSSLGMGWVAEGMGLPTTFYLGVGFLFVAGLAITLTLRALSIKGGDV